MSNPTCGNPMSHCSEASPKAAYSRYRNHKFTIQSSIRIPTLFMSHYVPLYHSVKRHLDNRGWLLNLILLHSPSKIKSTVLCSKVSLFMFQIFNQDHPCRTWRLTNSNSNCMNEMPFCDWAMYAGRDAHFFNKSQWKTLAKKIVWELSKCISCNVVFK